MQKDVPRLSDFLKLTKFKISIPVAVPFTDCVNYMQTKISEDEKK